MSNKDPKGYGPRVWVKLASEPWERDVVERNPYPRAKEYLPLAEHDAKLKLMHGMLDECDGLLGERDSKIASLEARVKELQDYAQKAEDKICTMEDQLESERKKREELEKHLETERMRLSACGVAALGYYEEPVADEYKSASLSDVLSLRSQLAADEEGYLERHHKGKRTKNMRARLEYRVRWYQEMIDMYGSKMMDGWMRDGLRRAKKELKELEEKEAANSK